MSLLVFDRGLVDQHDGNVIFDRIHTVARLAFQSRAVLHRRDRRFAVWTRENLEQFGVDRHAGDYMTPVRFCGTIQG